MPQHRDLPRCLSPEREHGDPQTANRVRQGAACAAPYILSTVSTRTQKTPRFASERLFSVVLHSESPERNTLSACIRNRRVRTPCQQAFGIARAKRHAGMLSRVPERNAMPACIRICPEPNRNARKPGKTAFAVKLRVGQRAGNGVHASGIFTVKIVERLGIAAEQPHARHLASRRCPLPPAAPQ